MVTCDGCGEHIPEKQLGRKIVIGCDNQFPPSRFFDYCVRCRVPPLAELAKEKPYIYFQSVDVLTTSGWAPIWSDGLMYDKGSDEFTDGYETIIPENEISPVIQ